MARLFFVVLFLGLSAVLQGAPEVSSLERAERMVIGGYVRLTPAPGSTTRSMKGRVELYVNGEWGTVCGHDWGQAEADVVCRELGYSNHGREIHNVDSALGLSQFRGPVVRSGIHCRENTSPLQVQHIIDCPYTNVNLHSRSCSHYHDVGVDCTVDDPVVPPPVRPYTARLTHGRTSSEGIVEVYDGMSWQQVCDTTWTRENTRVVCQSLGYDEGQLISTPQVFPPSQTRVWTKTFTCGYRDTEVAQCGPFGDIRCDTRDLVSVECNDRTVPRPPTRNRIEHVRFVDPYRTPVSQRLSGGLMEIYVDGRWYYVCSEQPRFGTREASTACRQAGYDYGVLGDIHRYIPQDVAIEGDFWQYTVDCSRVDAHLDTCDVIPTRRCSYTPVVVECHMSTPQPPRPQPPVPPTNVVLLMSSDNIQLIGSSLQSATVYIKPDENSEWGTLCNPWFNDADAGVVCREVGMVDGARVYPNAPQSPADISVLIWMSGRKCSGREMSLFDCPVSRRSQRDMSGCASHSSDVVVRCCDYQNC